MFIWIGIDDTDSRNGGCTTYTAIVIVKKLIDNGFNIIGFPRLVRLNPNIPWKTRGNGAISLQVGVGLGKKTKIGRIDGEDIFCYEKLSEKIEISEVRDIVLDVVDKFARLDDENTNSGIVILEEKPGFEVYINAVREVVSLDETKEILKDKNAFFKGYKNMRGLIGATASIAWENKNDRTFELITYREGGKWGSKRFVDDESTINMASSISSTFDNFDLENKHNRLVPSSPCPVLFGIRGEDSKDLIKARSMIKSEKVDCWMVFESNQGTDDHLEQKKIAEVSVYDSVIIKGKVSKKPFTIEGGHVIFSVSDETGKIDCAAYEPTKQFREIILGLIKGDNVEVYGGVREDPLTVNLEKIKIIDLEEDFEKVENPVCPVCKKHMKSIGSNQGYRCKKCSTKSEKPKIIKKKRKLEEKIYEVPVCARRHLSKPLKRTKQP